MCLLAIQISSLVKSVFKFFAYFLIGLFVFLYCIFKVLYITWIQCLGGICDLQAFFSQSVACLFFFFLLLFSFFSVLHALDMLGCLV